MQEKFQEANRRSINVMREMPREFLLILRNNNLLRSINRELGGPVNRLALFSRQAIRGAHIEDQNKMSFWTSFTSELVIRRLEWEMWLGGLFFRFARWMGWLPPVPKSMLESLKGPDEGQLFEEMPGEY